MDWEKIERGGIEICLIALVVLGCLALHPPRSNEGLMDVILTIKHYDAETKTTHTYVKTGDLLTKNFAIILVNCFRGAEGVGTLRPTDTNGNLRYLYDDYDYYVGVFSPCAWIAIGTGTGSPSPSDYKLQNQITKKYIGSHGLSKSGTALNITVSVTFTFDSSYSITEAGLIIECHQDTSSYPYLIARDVFPAVEVSSGDVLTVTYTFKLNQG